MFLFENLYHRRSVPCATEQERGPQKAIGCVPGIASHGGVFGFNFRVPYPQCNFN